MSQSELGRIGERFGAAFELVAPLPDRGLGEAWAAIDHDHNRRACLVKLFAPGRGSSSEWDSSIKRLRTLSHAKLPTLLEAGATADGRRWIAFESVSGRSLRNWLDGHREVGTTPGFGVMHKLFDAIAGAVHVGHGDSRGCVAHGAISPTSVILQPHSGGIHVVLLDHCVAPFASTVDAREYLAPEASERGAASAQADVFGLGVIWNELITLRATPSGDSRETWAELARRAPKAVKSTVCGLRSEVPKELWESVAEALTLDPARRPQTAKALASSVRDALPTAWRKLPFVEREPPLPSGRRAVATVERRDAGAVPVGWQEAERRPSVTPLASLVERSSLHEQTPSPRPIGEAHTPLVAREGGGAHLHAATLQDDELVAVVRARQDFASATLVDDDGPSAMREESVSAPPARPAGQARSLAQPAVTRPGAQTLDLSESDEHAGWNAQPGSARETDEVIPPRHVTDALARRGPGLGGDTTPIDGLPKRPRVGGDTTDLSEGFGAHPAPSSGGSIRPMALAPAPPSLSSGPLGASPLPPLQSRPARRLDTAAVTQDIPTRSPPAATTRWWIAGIAAVAIAAVLVALLAR